MKRFFPHRFLLAIVVGLAACTLLPAARAESLAISTTLILGNNDGNGVDASLKKYEAKLKRHFPFNTFKSVGASTAKLNVPGSGSVSISGYAIAFEASPAGDGKYRISAKWSKSGKTFVNTTVVAAKNSPTVLASPTGSDGTLILLFVPR